MKAIARLAVIHVGTMAVSAIVLMMVVEAANYSAMLIQAKRNG